CLDRAGHLLAGAARPAAVPPARHRPVPLGACARPCRGRGGDGESPGLALAPNVERRLRLVTPLVGLAVGVLAVVYAEASGHGVSDVLFSGQDAMGPLISQSASYSVGALVLLVACKGLAYGTSLGSFRGGRVFPAMVLGAAGGLAPSQP